MGRTEWDVYQDVDKDLSWNEFDYLQEKTNALNAENYDGKVWTVADTRAAFAEAGLTAEEHFEQYGKTEGFWNRAAPPAPYQGPSGEPEIEAPQMQYPEYSQNPFENQLRNLLGSYDPNKNWNPDAISMFADRLTSGISTWDEVAEQLTGLPKGFSAVNYIDQKTKQLNEIGFQGRTDWTFEDTTRAFTEQGFTAESHYFQYGKDEGFYKSPVDKVQALLPSAYRPTSSMSSDVFNPVSIRSDYQLEAPVVDPEAHLRKSAKETFKRNLEPVRI